MHYIEYLIACSFNKVIIYVFFFIFSAKQNENWMRHGYPAAMNQGGPVTILKRGPSVTSQMDTQVKFYYVKLIKVLCNFLYHKFYF